MHGGKRDGAGRKSARIDLAELEKLCALQCTDEDVAAFFGVTVRTIERPASEACFCCSDGERSSEGSAIGASLAVCPSEQRQHGSLDLLGEEPVGVPGCPQ